MKIFLFGLLSLILLAFLNIQSRFNSASKRVDIETGITQVVGDEELKMYEIKERLLKIYNLNKFFGHFLQIESKLTKMVANNQLSSKVKEIEVVDGFSAYSTFYCKYDPSDQTIYNIQKELFRFE